MSNPTSYAFCHDCKETTHAISMVEVMVPARYGDAAIAAPEEPIARYSAHVCLECWDRHHQTDPKPDHEELIDITFGPIPDLDLPK